MSRRIPVQDLMPGHFVERLEGVFWQETDRRDFPLQSLNIRSEADIDKIRKYGCQFVYIRDRSYRPLVATAQIAPTAFPKRLAEARETYTTIRTLAMPLHRTVRAGRPLNVTGLDNSLRRLIPKIARHEDALLWLTNMNKQDDTVVRHCINVCILSLVFGKHLGLQHDALVDLSVGALLHDIGKVKLSRRLLNLDRPPTPDEQTEIARHIGFGVDIVDQAGSFSRRVRDIVRDHHEYFDGSGYPRGVRLDQPEQRLAQIVVIVDYYDNLVRGRGGDSALCADRAVEILQTLRGTKLHPELVNAFVECIGHMPVGNLLELNGGEVGIELAKSSGVYLVFFDGQKRRLPTPKIVGLKFDSRPHQEVCVRRMLRPGDYDLNFNECIDRAVNF